MIKMKMFLFFALAGIITACTGSKITSHKTPAEPAVKQTTGVVLMSEVKWEQLNPARGDKSPMAGNLWGNRNESGPSGFLVKFVDGFSSPPHIHNVSYRGVVISGLIHNDDLSAKHVWMPQGSFWTQPAGEVHITAAKGNENIAYIEIDNGPFLVRAADEAFDNGERPVNIDKSKLVWLDASDIKWIESPETQAPSNGPKMAFLWGNQQGGSTQEGKLGGYF
ncbi:MAG: DUF4437 domain-containing protein, partial [Candidatus Dadabacteria bacterium]|nr:DUF4437 domain-containing protein [Candidatus Dadabacteria bacterium]NIY22665.1 DUF4437 domain-containing protein [Candidatus Dadabacteria bacterium]